MKPASFEYHRADSLATALELTAEFTDDGKLLAGGQSLVPAMNFRLARPSHLIDLNPAHDLAYIDATASALRLGSMTRQRDIERDPAIMVDWPLLSSAVGYIGHVQIRNRGTIGGSVAHADPAAELPAVLVAMDASLLLRRRSGERAVSASDFFVHYMTTILEPDEMIAEIRIPKPPEDAGYSFLEISRRRGDFALVGLATVLGVDRTAAITVASLVFTGVGPTPQRVPGLDALLLGERGTPRLFAAAAVEAERSLNPESDVHADAEYRRDLARRLAERGLAQAYERAMAAAGAAGDGR